MKSEEMPGNEWRWKPRLRGLIYCSPGCGGDCKRADYERAKENAAKLATLLGPGWKPSVWENLGWHFAAQHVSGNANVHPSYPAKLFNGPATAFLNFPGRQTLGKGPTPQAALRAAIEELNRVLEEQENALAEVLINTSFAAKPKPKKNELKSFSRLNWRGASK